MEMTELQGWIIILLLVVISILIVYLIEKIPYWIDHRSPRGRDDSDNAF